MALLRACLMELRARRGDWDSAPAIAVKSAALLAVGAIEPSTLVRPQNLTEPQPREGRNFSGPAAYMPA